MSTEEYPPIADYAYIADCHSAALVSKHGSIDWCCMPRLDSGSCFARILGWENGGFCQIAPRHRFEVSREYIEDTLVLATTFHTAQGRVRLVDCFPMRKGGQHHPYQQILRVVEGVEGSVELKVMVVPRFDYGAVKPWIRCVETHYVALGGNDGLLISGDMPLAMKHRHDLEGTFTVARGERYRLSILYRRPEALDEGSVRPPSADEMDQRLEETIEWWREWFSQSHISGPYSKEVGRSAIVLKGLSNAPTGAIAAAPTTSLPESPGGPRNWDYRFSWIRDSSFAARSLGVLGFHREADGFRRFIERSAAGSAEELQVMFGIGGERRLHEHEIDELEGYRGARPVRTGNAAESQMQLDMYGELLDLSWNWHRRGHSPDDDFWEFLVSLVDAASQKWRQPDKGIWELRGAPCHFVQSKAMCWSALERGIRIAEETGRQAPLERWREARQKIRREIEEKGYDGRRGVFTQAFGNSKMDAALLLLPITGFIAFDDPRMIRTTDAVWEELQEGGLLRRYPPGEDGFEAREGVFLACSFWMAECLARQKRLERAHRVFKRALETGNDLCLFSEEYDVEAHAMLGNFPQGLTHLSLITASVALAEMEQMESASQKKSSNGD